MRMICWIFHIKIFFFWKNKPCWQWCSKRKQYILGLNVSKTFWITFHTAKHYSSTLLPIILRLFIKNRSHGWRASCIWTVKFKRLQEVELHSIKCALWSLRQFLATKSPLQMMKKAFYFTLKTLPVLKILLHFCLEFLVMLKNGLIR